MPELQGRFPIRVELTDLTKDDFVRILKEPKNSLTRQYDRAARNRRRATRIHRRRHRLAGRVRLSSQSDRTQNIGARRLYTIMERLLEELSFEASDMGSAR